MIGVTTLWLKGTSMRAGRDPRASFLNRASAGVPWNWPSQLRKEVTARNIAADAAAAITM